MGERASAGTGSKSSGRWICKAIDSGVDAFVGVDGGVAIVSGGGMHGSKNDLRDW